MSHSKHEFLEGDFSLMVYCSWRLSKGGTVVTSWKESNIDDGPMMKGLNLLRGLAVQSFQLSNFNDIKMSFEKSFVLEVFCDLSSNYDFDTNWFFRDKDIHYSINNRNEIQEELP